MKKTILSLIAVAAVSLMACTSHASNNSSESSEPSTQSEATAASGQDYKIEDGKIIPLNNRPMMVDFSASWCPPCRQLKPIFESLKDEYKGKIDFVTIDVDENSSLSAAYGVQSIPTIIYINPQGVELSRTIGFHDKDELKADIAQQFNL